MSRLYTRTHYFWCCDGYYCVLRQIPFLPMDISSSSTFRIFAPSYKSEYVYKLATTHCLRGSPLVWCCGGYFYYCEVLRTPHSIYQWIYPAQRLHPVRQLEGHLNKVDSYRYEILCHIIHGISRHNVRGGCERGGG